MYTIGWSKNYKAKSLFRQNNTPSQQKGSRVPLNPLGKVETELKKLTDDGQIVKLDKCPDNLFISPFVLKKIKASQ